VAQACSSLSELRRGAPWWTAWYPKLGWGHGLELLLLDALCKEDQRAACGRRTPLNAAEERACECLTESMQTLSSSHANAPPHRTLTPSLFLGQGSRSERSGIPGPGVGLPRHTEMKLNFEPPRSLEEAAFLLFKLLNELPESQRNPSHSLFLGSRPVIGSTPWHPRLRAEAALK
jgi:hypothetical protein